MDSISDDCWLNFELPMFALVDPNDICPIGILTETNQTLMNNENMSINNSNTNATTSAAVSNNYYIYDNAIPVEQTVQISSVESYQGEQQQFHQDNVEQQVAVQQPMKENMHLFITENQTQDENYVHCNLAIEPPPMLLSHEEPKHEPQHHLSLGRVLSKHRQDKIRIRLQRQPPQSPVILTRKASGRKMTGRERQQELEKQEAHQLKLKSQYLNLIDELEQKCTRLRQILENIVATSPEYNRQMLSFLENSNLLYDQESDSRNVEEDALTSIVAPQSHL